MNRLNAFFLVGFLVALAFGAAGGESTPVRSTAIDRGQFYAVGGALSLNIREGYYDFPSIERSQDTARKTVLMVGGTLGRRYMLLPWLGMQMGGSLSYGTVAEDTLVLSSGSAYTVRHTFLHAGLEPELHFVLPAVDYLTPFIRVGGGMDYVRFRERFYQVANPLQEVVFGDFSARDKKRWCPHGHAGAGLDVIRKKSVGLSIGYIFRIWMPVRYDDTRDLPLDAVAYREIFYTHCFLLTLLLAFE